MGQSLDKRNKKKKQIRQKTLHRDEQILVDTSIEDQNMVISCFCNSNFWEVVSSIFR